ncbi:MAG: biotin synthase BioB [Desulfosoma sp.]|uniref:biotin synthase BioB n=1 Tax=Desulfosoma sp. TaxID=2603217 RepID=UPI00404A85D6
MAEFFQLAEKVLKGKELSRSELLSVIECQDHNIWELVFAANSIREHFFGDGIHLCMIQNAKSGRCSEDCGFCAQSGYAHTNVPVYGFVGKDKILDFMECLGKDVHRFSVVTSGRRLLSKDIQELCLAFEAAPKERVGLCASLGTLSREDLKQLKQAGLTRYHHNLETAPSYFSSICTTHSFEERVMTIRTAKDVGLEVCSGGIFGMGETFAQVLELALVLKELDVDAVPVNFFTPIPGTRLGHLPGPSPLQCLKIIAILRFVLPDKELIICGGREYRLKELHPLVFLAGASGIMTGNYLTTKGRNYDADRELLALMQLRPRPKGRADHALSECKNVVET